MKENKFMVDLGQIKLSAEDRMRINAAIQRAVAGELALTKLRQQVVLIPTHGDSGASGSDDGGGGGTTNGIVGRVINKAELQRLTNGK